MNRGCVRLKEWMTKNSVSQVELAKRMTSARGAAAIHQTSVSTWLHGRVPSLEMAVLLRKVTKIPVEAWGEAADGPSKRETLPPTGT